MKRIDCGTSGSSIAAAHCWDDFELGPPWRKVIEVLAPGSL